MRKVAAALLLLSFVFLLGVQFGKASAYCSPAKLIEFSGLIVGSHAAAQKVSM